MPRRASRAQVTPVSATQPSVMRTPREPSTFAWKLPPHRQNARPSAFQVCSSVSPRSFAAAAVDPNGTQIPVGSKPSYSASPRFIRMATSVPVATAVRNSAPVAPPESSAAASAAEMMATPACGPGAAASQ